MRSARSAESPRPSSCCKATKNSSPAVWVPNNSVCSGFAQPFRKDGVLRIEHRFIQKGDGGEGRLAGVVRGVAGGQGLAGRGLDCLAGMVAEGIGVGQALAVGAQAHDGGKNVLEKKRQILWSAGIGRRRHRLVIEHY